MVLAVEGTFGGALWGVLMAAIFWGLDNEPWMPGLAIYVVLGVMVLAPLTVWKGRRAKRKQPYRQDPS